MKNFFDFAKTVEIEDLAHKIVDAGLDPHEFILDWANNTKVKLNEGFWDAIKAGWGSFKQNLNGPQGQYNNALKALTSLYQQLQQSNPDGANIISDLYQQLQQNQGQIFGQGQNQQAQGGQAQGGQAQGGQAQGGQAQHGSGTTDTTVNQTTPNTAPQNGTNAAPAVGTPPGFENWSPENKEQYYKTQQAQKAVQPTMTNQFGQKMDLQNQGSYNTSIVAHTEYKDNTIMENCLKLAGIKK